MRQTGKVDDKMTVEELWRWKHIYDSAYHPDTGRKMPLIGATELRIIHSLSLRFFLGNRTIALIVPMTLTAPQNPNISNRLQFRPWKESAINRCDHFHPLPSNISC
uniref:Uncharacterized protein n=1 Tax=Parascaris equorum TaxID=6256 RepID=A0A914R9E7_PAREQ